MGAASYSKVRVFNIGNTELTVFVSDEIVSGSAKTASHYHLYHEMHFITEGKCLINADNVEYIAGVDDTVIIPQNMVHMLEDFADCQRASLTFLARKIPVSDPEFTFENIFSEINSIDKFTVIKKSYAKKISKIIKCASKSDIYNITATKHHLALLFIDIAKSLNSNPGSTENSENIIGDEFYRAMVIERYIGVNYSNPDANLSELANLMFLSPKQTQRITKSITGLSFKQLLLKQRMHIARELLTTTDKDINSIAVLSGYNSYGVFYKAFTKYFNVTPLQLREEIKNCK